MTVVKGHGTDGKRLVRAGKIEFDLVTHPRHVSHWTFGIGRVCTFSLACRCSALAPRKLLVLPWAVITLLPRIRCVRLVAVDRS